MKSTTTTSMPNSTAFKTAVVSVKILGVVGVASSVYNIATAENKPQAAVRELAGWGGAAVGAEALGSFGASIGGPWGALIGGVIGGMLGYAGMTSFFDTNTAIMPVPDRPMFERDNTRVAMPPRMDLIRR